VPFTLSHVAAVLPLLDGGRGRGRLVGAGLVAGAMAPDVPFHAESMVRGWYRFGAVTHRWWAVPTVDVAVAGAMAAWWYGLLRGPLTEAATGRVPEPAGRVSAGWFAVSAAVGAATHVGLDAFTHEGRAGVRALPVLARRPVTGVPLYTVLQYGTSLLGLAVLGRHVVRHAGRRGVAPRGRAVRVLAAGTALGAVHRLARRERGRITEACFGGGAGLVVGATAYALGVQAAAWRHASRGTDIAHDRSRAGARQRVRQAVRR